MPRLSKIGAAALAAFGWTSGASAVSATYLVVAGGGGGGAFIGGGAGAGGLLTGTTSLSLSSNYTIIVGAGGGASSAGGVNGSNSTAFSLTAIGGGFGGTFSPQINPSVGGSGGGGSRSYTTTGSVAGAAGTSGQGNAGGTGKGLGGTNNGGGGGGGAGGVGADDASGQGGNGGIGVASSISGTSTYYAGGGGGGVEAQTAGSGGLGGGGAGSGAIGNPGSQNTGGGGGAGGYNGGSNNYGGNGGSGVVIISYPAPQQFGGGIVTTSGGNVIHTFQTSGTLSPLSSLSASYLIVAGGGGGGAGRGGGGGAGGMLTGSGVAIDTNSTYLVTVGSGGAGTLAPNNAQGSNGLNSSAFGLTAIGGGAGDGANTNLGGVSGGSGGGGASPDPGPSTTSGGAGTLGQGNAGGSSTGGSPYYAAGGGGGAGGVGQNGGSVGGAGGIGIASSITGTSVYYAGGGGGGRDSGNGGAGGTGGGGAAGSGQNSPGTSGTANTGGGGGGAGGSNGGNGGNGGSGIVIISYAGSTQQMAGGTVTIVGGNVIHTFTSSGYLTPLKFVGNSLRFRNSASAYLSKTFPTSPTSNQKLTFSAWIKRGLLSSSAEYSFFGGYDGSSSNSAFIQFKNDSLRVVFGGGSNYDIATSAVYRDPAAWYHVVVAIDTTQATASNRVQLYVNGSQVTSFSTTNYPPQNATSQWLYANGNNAIGSYYGGVGAFFDGEMTEINVIDGQQLGPNAFGSFNSYGVWQPITYGGSYGTNGFYLPFTGSTSYAGSFNGSNQTLQIANNAAFSNPGTQNFTIEGWFYFSALGGTASNVWGCNNGSGSNPKMSSYVDNNGTLHFDFTTAGGASTVTTASGTITTGKWCHVAYVRNSGVFTVYLNGVPVGSASASVNLTGLTQPFYIGYVGENYGNTFNGYISNFRYVLGTAVYTTNFTPQTTPLTNISGTVLLTLQNASIVDNSSNAFTITNNNSVTTSQSFPFVATIGYDKGPAGNNWTINNFGSQLTTSIDNLTDVPTLTSATAANYAVLNPLIGNGATITNGNLTISGGNDEPCTMLCPPSGKWYAEFFYSNASNSCHFGIYDNSKIPVTINNAILYRNDGAIYVNNSQTATFSSYVNGDTVGIAVDIVANLVYFYKNNTLQGSVNFVSSAGISTSNVIYGVRCNSGVTANVNFGQQPFVYTPPSGFVALNTYNL
jgi:hypothetical protein